MIERQRFSALRYSPRPLRPGATVSVVIPCFNYGRFLPAAVHSVLSQEGVVVDVIVVDDASTDDSRSVAETLARSDPRVKVLANAINSGAVATFNRGLAEARGEYLVRLDADDLLTPGSLGRAVAVMQHLPGVGLVYGHPIHFAGEKLPAAREVATAWISRAGQEWLAVRCVDGTNTITSPEVLMRKSVVDRVGGQRDLAHAHDMEMWLRMSVIADVAYVAGADQAWHREHPGSLSTTAEEPIVILHHVRMAFNELFSTMGDLIVGSAALQDSALRALAFEATDQAGRRIDRGESVVAARDLLNFASSCAPAIRSSKVWQATARRADPAYRVPRLVTRLGGTGRRLRRRSRSRARYARWVRTGEYEPMSVTPALLDDELN